MSDKTKTILLLVAVVVIFGTLAFRVYSAKMHEKALQQAMFKKVKASEKAAAKSDAAVVPVKPQRAPGTYGLDGVIEAGDSSMAIVNGKLLKVEGTIDTLILKKISHKEVELLNTKDNSTVILKM